MGCDRWSSAFARMRARLWPRRPRSAIRGFCRAVCACDHRSRRRGGLSKAALAAPTKPLAIALALTRGGNEFAVEPEIWARASAAAEAARSARDLKCLSY